MLLYLTSGQSISSSEKKKNEKETKDGKWKEKEGRKKGNRSKNKDVHKEQETKTNCQKRIHSRVNFFLVAWNRPCDASLLN